MLEFLVIHVHVCTLESTIHFGYSVLKKSSMSFLTNCKHKTTAIKYLPLIITCKMFGINKLKDMTWGGGVDLGSLYSSALRGKS